MEGVGAVNDVTRPFDGVRVLELAEGISGPFAGRWLAALGADVVKIERTTGDPSRAFGRGLTICRMTRRAGYICI